MPFRENASKYSFPVGSPGCDHRLYSHLVQFHSDEESLLRIAGGFLFGALKAGDGVVVLATRAHRMALAQRLGDLGIDIEAHLRRGTYAEINAEEMLAELLVDKEVDFSRLRDRIVRTLEAVNSAAAVVEPRAMVFGELVSLLWEKRKREAVLALERLWEELAREYSFSLLCGYSVREFCEVGSEDVYLQFCAVHSTVIPPDEYPTAEVEQRILQATARSYRESPSMAEGLE
jgi:MEDS: MEthanogen/methylotroph, DcmR Sensory domain